MKMIKLSDDHYVVVDDSEIKMGDWIGLPNLKKFVPVQYLGGDLTGYEKKITHSAQPLDCACSNRGYKLDTNCAERNRCFDKVQYLPVQEVKELLGVVDVEKLAKNHLDGHHNNEDIAYPELYDAYNSFLNGYSQALEDNKDKKYTETDIKNAIIRAYSIMGNKIDVGYFNEVIQSLQPQTEWDVEFVDGKLKLKK